MKNKTCGECIKHDIDCFIAKQAKACEYFESKIKTNGDRIRSMSDEELAVWGMYDLGTCPTFEKHQTCSKCGECSASEIEQCWLNWLKQEVKDE